MAQRKTPAQKMASAMKRDRTLRAKRPTDKWIIGMVETSYNAPGAPDTPQLRMLPYPKLWTDYDAAVAHAVASYHKYGKPFVVFAKKCVIGPSRPPILKQEYLA